MNLLMQLLLLLLTTWNLLRRVMQYSCSPVNFSICLFTNVQLQLSLTMHFRECTSCLYCCLHFGDLSVRLFFWRLQTSTTHSSLRLHIFWPCLHYNSFPYICPCNKPTTVSTFASFCTIRFFVMVTWYSIAILSDFQFTLLYNPLFQ